MYRSYGINDVSGRFLLGGCELTVSGVRHCEFSENRPRNGLHIHDCFEVCIVLSGSGTFYQGDKAYPVEDDDVFVCEPYRKHEIVVEEGAALSLAFFSFAIYEKQREEGPLARFLEGHETVAKSCSHIVPYFYMLTSYLYAGGERALSDLLRLLLTDVLEALLQSRAGLGGMSRGQGRLTEKLTRYILSHPQEKLYVKDMGRACGISERGLYYYFAEKLATTPTQFIGQTRISAACEYLQMGFSVTDTAAALGFSDLSSFSRLFKKHRGISPREYVKKSLYQS